MALKLRFVYADTVRSIYHEEQFHIVTTRIIIVQTDKGE